MRNQLAVLRTSMNRLLHWWLAELQLCAGDLIGLLFPRWRQIMIVYVDQQDVTFFDQAGVAIFKIALDRVAPEPVESVPEPIQRARLRGNRVRVIVNPSLAYVRQLEMPLAATDYLGSAIALQSPKWLPISSANLLTDFEIKDTDDTAGRLTIDLAAIKKAQADELIDRLRELGLRVVSMHLGDAPKAHYRFRFLQGRFSKRSYKLRRADKWLLASAVSLGVLCALIGATQSYRSQHELDAAVAQTTAPAAAALMHRQKLLQQLAPLVLLSQFEETPSATALLAEMTALVPSNTWLTTLELKERKVRIVGLSPDSAAVVRHLSSSPLLADAALHSSMSAGIGTGLDRFEVTASLKGSAP